MKRAYVLSVLAIVALTTCCVASAHERVVIVPDDCESFTVTENDVVRITGEGIAGARIVAVVEGPATIIAENVIASMRNGQPVIGPGNREFEIKPTGKGYVKVTIISTPPTGDEPTVCEYEFRVE